MLSEHTIERLSLYRRLLTKLQQQNQLYVYSHELAAISHGTAAQVRRDLMLMSFTGSPAKGYHVSDLIESIDRLLDAPDGQKIALVGLGNLGRAIIAYFHGRRPKLTIVAAFDTDTSKVNRLFYGCRCYPADQLQSVAEEQHINLAVIAVPAEEAQHVADALIAAGVMGILNFAPVPLRVPQHVYVQDIDVTMLLEKTAYFARSGDQRRSKS